MNFILFVFRYLGPWDNFSDFFSAGLFRNSNSVRPRSVNISAGIATIVIETMDRSSTLSLLRQLYRELRKTRSMGQKHVYDSSHWKYIISTVRSARNLDPGHEQVQRMGTQGQNFLQYLESSRVYMELLEKYKGKGERDPGDLAKILGFRMPNEPKEPRKPRGEKVESNNDAEVRSEKSSGST